MSDMKPKRTPRETGRSDNSGGAPALTGTTPIVPAAIVAGAIFPEARTAAPAVSAAPAAVAQLAPEPVSATLIRPTDSAGGSSDDWSEDYWTAVAEAQAAFARGLEAIAVEMTGMTGSGIAAATDAAIALSEARTLSEAVAINAGLARRGIDWMIEGSARLSEIGVTALGEASRPMLAPTKPARRGGTWISAHPG